MSNILCDASDRSENTYGMKRVYVLESESGLVKIGVSCEFDRRKRTIETQSGFNMKNYFHTDWVSNYSQIEKASHDAFRCSRVLGEWFTVPFSEAVGTVKNICAEMGASIPKKMPTREDIEKFFQSFRSNEPEDINIHCKYCLCPDSTWKPVLKTYRPENETKECKLFSDVLDVIWELERASDNFTLEDICFKSKREYESEHPGALDFVATVKEIVAIYSEEGICHSSSRILLA